MSGSQLLMCWSTTPQKATVFLKSIAILITTCHNCTSPKPDHIEDTNGADNYSLQTITEQDVVEQKMGSRGTVAESETKVNVAGISISDGKKYASSKFTGVYRLYDSTLFKGSDIYVNLAEFTIKEGNFAFYIVFDGEVVGKIEPNETGIAEFTLDNVGKTGSLEYVIAGECQLLLYSTDRFLIKKISG